MQPSDLVAPAADYGSGDESASELIQRVYEEEKAALADQERQLKALAKEIEGKFNTDSAQRQRKEMEWYWAERLQLGSMWRYWNRWSVEDSTNPLGRKDDEYGAGNSPEFNIVKPKIKIGQAQLEMLQFGAGTDKNFTIKAKKSVQLDSDLVKNSPVFMPDGQTPLMGQDGQQKTIGQLALERSQADDECARKMDEEVWAQLSSVNYGEKMRNGFHDLLWYGSAIYKGPFNNNKCKKVRYQASASDGSPLWITAYTEEPTPDFSGVNPWLFYPDHRALCIDDAEHATEVHIYTPTQFARLARQDGFRKDTIGQLLQEKPANNYYPAFRARAVQYNNTKFLEGKYVCLEWHGTVGIKQLGSLGIEPPYENPMGLYKAEIWVCQGEVIYAVLEMLEADEGLPYAVSVWEPDPASLFGFGAILLRDGQRVVNMAYKMYLDNAGLCALPQVAVDTDAFKPQDGKPEIVPGKVWRRTENGMGQSITDAIQFFFPPNNLDMLGQVMDRARDFANEESIIPLIAGGLEDAQVSDGGATGYALRLQSSTTVLSSKARQWDDNITKKVVGWFYEWNMQYSDKNEIKGDFDIDVQTSTAYLNKMIGQRDLERLSVQAAQDPDMKFLVDRTALLRAMLTGMNIPYDSIVYSKEQSEILRQQAMQAAQNNPDPNAIKAQADMLNAQARMGDVQNDTAKLEFDKQQGMVEAQMEYQKYMANQQTRNNEAQSRALAAASDRDVALANLAQKDRQAAQQMMTDLDIAQQQRETDQFLAGVSAHQTQQKLALEARNTAVKEKEAKKAQETGKGW